MKKDKIVTFYDDKMVLSEDSKYNTSKSPLKPKLMMKHLTKAKLIDHFDVRSFEPFTKKDFYIAHTEEYVNNFFDGIYPESESNHLQWSEQFADTVKYTNASLYHAIRHSIENPNEVAFSPTSGFHHAMPWSGDAFCTFSGQVVASLKIYRELGLCGAYIDLDGHFGNSIEDSREFDDDVNIAIPEGCNINVKSHSTSYLRELREKLEDLYDMIMQDKIHYIVFCHGADSHEDDDFGGMLNTQQWLECSKIVYNFVNDIEKELKRPFPISLSLFGGYRKDDYNSVLSLHTADLVKCLNILCGHKILYKTKVKRNLQWK